MARASGYLGSEVLDQTSLLDQRRTSASQVQDIRSWRLSVRDMKGWTAGGLRFGGRAPCGRCALHASRFACCRFAGETTTAVSRALGSCECSDGKDQVISALHLPCSCPALALHLPCVLLPHHQIDEWQAHLTSPGRSHPALGQPLPAGLLPATFFLVFHLFCIVQPLLFASHRTHVN